MSKISEMPPTWAFEQASATIAMGLVPQTQSLQINYTQTTTRAEFATLAVALYEKVFGTITARHSFDSPKTNGDQK